MKKNKNKKFKAIFITTNFNDENGRRAMIELAAPKAHKWIEKHSKMKKCKSFS